MSKSRRSKISKKKVIIIVAVLLVLALAGIFAVRAAKKKVADTYGNDDDAAYTSAEVTTGSISTTVSGSGTLEDVDVTDYTIPSSVEIEKYYVSSGESVEKGDLLASVKTTSVVSAMSDLQDEIDELDDEIADAGEDTVSSTITTKVSGRVKAIYAHAGSDVASVMYKNGALAVISLDGYMAVDIETSKLSAGNKVKVTVSGTTYTGKVDSVANGKATILISDKSAVIGDKATVKRKGKKIGSGKLYVHEPLTITGYAGTVKAVKITKNETVDAGDTCFTLKDTSYSANYETLLEEREDLEDDMDTLVSIYKQGAVYAQMSGTITSITEGSTGSSGSSSSGSSSGSSSSGSSSSGSSSSGSSSSGSSSGSTGSAASLLGLTSGSTSSDSNGSGTSTTEGTDTVFSICPDKQMSLELSIDESDILSLEEGQTASVTVDSIDDQTFEGTVTDIEKSGSSSSGVTSYTAEVTIDKTDDMLSGMSASATITIEGVDDALLVPVDAVQKTSTNYYVYTSYDEENGTFGDMVEITVGINNGTYYEVTGGLSEGDTVYYTSSDDSDDFSSMFQNGMGGGDFGGGNMPGGDSSMGGGNMPGGDSNKGGGSMPGASSGN